MKNIIAAIVVVLCTAAGSFGASFLKSKPADSADASEHGASDKDSHGAAKDDGHGKKDAHGSDDGHGKKKEKKKKDSHGGGDGHGKKKASGGHGGGHGGSGGSDTMYFKFSREFIVPIMDEKRVRSLVILNINLEADSSMSDLLFSMEPKLRDNIMTSLISISSDGHTFQNFNEVESYEAIRTTVLKNVSEITGPGINNILILDIARQDM